MPGTVRDPGGYSREQTSTCLHGGDIGMEGNRQQRTRTEYSRGSEALKTKVKQEGSPRVGQRARDSHSEKVTSELKTSRNEDQPH